MTDLPNKMSFEINGFSLYGHKINEHGWYEFDAIVGEKEFKGIGGELGRVVLIKLSEIINNSHGTPIKEMVNAAYKDIVGVDNSEYIGYLVFSGYNTFYFFRDLKDSIYIVFADKEGKLLAHSKLQEESFESWLTTISILMDRTRI